MENNKISVLHTIEDLKLTSGGPTRTVLGLVNALSKIDIDVFLATQNLLHEEYLSPKNIKIFETYAYKYSIFKNHPKILFVFLLIGLFVIWRFYKQNAQRLNEEAEALFDKEPFT